MNKKSEDHVTLFRFWRCYSNQVENAVKHCLEFSAARKVPFDLMSEISDNVSKTSFGMYSLFNKLW